MFIDCVWWDEVANYCIGLLMLLMLLEGGCWMVYGAWVWIWTRLSILVLVCLYVWGQLGMRIVRFLAVV